MAFSVPHALLQADLVLELNGKKVGEILRPAGDIDVSEAVCYGEENEFAWMLTRFGAEARKGQTLWADMDHRNPPGLTRAPELTVTPWTRITDVFCNPSWREKRLRVEIEVTCGEDPSDGDLSVAIRDEAGAAGVQALVGTLCGFAAILWVAFGQKILPLPFQLHVNLAIVLGTVVSVFVGLSVASRRPPPLTSGGEI